MEKNYKPRVHDWKKDEVKDILNLCKSYPIWGIVNLENLPARLYQKIRKQLRGTVEMKMTRKDFMIKAIESIKPKNYERLLENLKGVPALIFTKEDPFKLFKLLDKNKIFAAAKAGEISPIDIVIDSGPTPFAPGPMIGELGALGLKTEVKEGKIGIRESKVLVPAGKEINAKIASLLPKFGIEPVQVGLNLTLTYNNGEILTAEVLGVKEEVYIANIQLAFTESINLAVFSGYMTKESVEIMVKKAQVEALSIDKAGDVEAKINEVPEPKPLNTESSPSVTVSNGAVEAKPSFSQNEMEEAKKILNKVIDNAVKLDKTHEKKVDLAQQQQEKDLNKIINKLKDQKSKGQA